MNLLLLLTIGVLPFATSLMAEYVNKSSGQHVAAAVYSGAFLAMSIAFSVMNRHILLSKPDLHGKQMSIEQRRHILFRSISGLVPYAVATGLARPLSPGQLLWINLLSDVLPAMGLAMTPPDLELITRPLPASEAQVLSGGDLAQSLQQILAAAVRSACRHAGGDGAQTILAAPLPTRLQRTATGAPGAAVVSIRR